MRLSYDAESAIQALQEGLNPSRPHSFAQADMLVSFQLLVSPSLILFCVASLRARVDIVGAEKIPGGCRYIHKDHRAK